MDSQDPRQGINEALRYGHLGIQFALVVALLAAGGWWLDKKLGTSPLLGFLGLMLGFGIGLWQLYTGTKPGGRPPREG